MLADIAKVWPILRPPVKPESIALPLFLPDSAVQVLATMVEGSVLPRSLTPLLPPGSQWHSGLGHLGSLTQHCFHPGLLGLHSIAPSSSSVWDPVMFQSKYPWLIHSLCPLPPPGSQWYVDPDPLGSLTQHCSGAGPLGSLTRSQPYLYY